MESQPSNARTRGTDLLWPLLTVLFVLGMALWVLLTLFASAPDLPAIDVIFV